MNLFLIIGICLVALYLLLNFFAKASSKKIAKGIRFIIFTIGIIFAIALFFVGRYAFSIPILLLLVPLIKLKGIGGLFQLFQLWRLINYLRQTGRYSFSSVAIIELIIFCFKDVPSCPSLPWPSTGFNGNGFGGWI